MLKCRILALMLAVGMVASSLAGQTKEKPLESLMAEPVASDINRERMFPQSNPPAETVWTFDVAKINDYDRILLTTAQGLINSETPQLFFFSTIDDTKYSADKDWLPWLKEKGYLKNYEEIKSMKDLLKKWNINEIIVIDQNLPASLNVATMMAGVEKIPAAYPDTVRKYNLKIKIDLRGRWKSNIEAYQWAFDGLWPKMDHTVVAWFASMSEYSQLRDYLVAKKIFTFWVTGPKDGNPKNSNTEQEKQFFRELLVKKIPVNIPVIGFPWASNEEGINEIEGVDIMTRAGKFHVCNNWRPNLSVWTGMKSKRQTYKQLPPAVLKLQNDKVYVTLLMSDGDNQNTWFNYFPEYWKSPLHGRIPIAWTMGPTIIDMQPPLVDFYFDSIKQTDSIGCAVSGAGYIFPTTFAADFKPQCREQIWKDFLTITQRYMDRLDMKWVHIFRHADKKDTPLYHYTDIPSIDAIFCDYWGVLDYPETHYTIGDTVVFHALRNDGGTTGLMQDILRQVPEKKPAFFFIFITNWRYTYSDIQKVVEQFPSNFVVVRPDEMTQLYRDWLATTQPKE